jgi:hypothetical protein
VSTFLPYDIIIIKLKTISLQTSSSHSAHRHTLAINIAGKTQPWVLGTLWSSQVRKWEKIGLNQSFPPLTSTCSICPSSTQQSKKSLVEKIKGWPWSPLVPTPSYTYNSAHRNIDSDNYVITTTSNKCLHIPQEAGQEQNMKQTQCLTNWTQTENTVLSLLCLTL